MAKERKVTYEELEECIKNAWEDHFTNLRKNVYERLEIAEIMAHRMTPLSAKEKQAAREVCDRYWAALQQDPSMVANSYDVSFSALVRITDIGETGRVDTYLPNIKIASYFSDPIFKKDQYGRLDLSGMDLRKLGQLARAVDFSDTNLDAARMEGMPLENTRFLRASLQNTQLSGASLSGGVRFYGADLKGANLENALLANADFTEANLEDANLSNAKGLKLAHFNGANLQNAKFQAKEEQPNHSDHADISVIKPKKFRMARNMEKTIGLSSAFHNQLKEERSHITFEGPKEAFFACENLGRTGDKELCGSYIVSGPENSSYHIENTLKTLFPNVLDGWKFHISVHRDDIVKAWDAIIPILLDEQKGVSHVKVIDVDDVYDKGGRKPLFPDLNSKEMTIYTYKNQYTGALEKTVEEWDMLFKKIKHSFKEKGIRPGDIPETDLKLKGNAFVSLRNDKDKDGNYVSAKEAHQNPNPGGYTNPYITLVAKERTSIEALDLHQNIEQAKSTGSWAERMKDGNPSAGKSWEV